MKFILVALAVFTVCAAQSDADWERYQQQYGKSYRSVEENAKRRAAWEGNWKKIKQHNEDFARGAQTYTLGENQFADLTYEEFSQQYLGLSANVRNPKFDSEHVMSGKLDFSKAINEHDMRPLGHVPPIRNQGQCGACWAFAVITSLEIQYARRNNVNPPDLSEQQLVDCSKALLLGIIRRNNGCNGGQLEPTYGDISQGLESESTYPYTATNGTCKFSTARVTHKFTGSFVQVKNEPAFLDAVKQGYVVVIGIYASSKFQLYKSGVYSADSSENTAQPNHAVAIIGFYVDDGGNTANHKHYYIRNSWATTWGENGYMRLHYGIGSLNLLSMSGYYKY